MKARGGNVWSAVAIAIALSALVAAPVFAQETPAAAAPLETRIREISFDSDGNTRVVASVSGSALGATTLDAGSFAVTENGRPITDLKVEQLFATGNSAVAVALVMDVSQSTRGAPLAAAKTAAKDFVRALPPSVRVAVIPFGGSPQLAQDFTVNRDAVNIAIDRQEAAGGTALYDAVLMAADRLDKQFDAQRNIVIFSDGEDTSSEATLADAMGAARALQAPVTTVLLRGAGIDERSMRAMAGAVKGGRFVRVDDASNLAAAFARIAQSIASQYVLTYRSDDVATPDLSIGVRVNYSGFVATDQSFVINERRRAAPPAPPTVRRGPLIGFLTGTVGLTIGILAAFFGILMFLVVIASAPAARGAEKMLQRSLRIYSRSDRKRERIRGEGDTMFSTTAVGRRAVEWVEKVPLSKKFDEQIQREIDQAGWPLRSSELLLIQLGVALGAVIIGAGLLQRWWLGVALGLMAFFVPRALLSNRINKRNADFLAQLPETLQLLAGSLQAGYGFLQALDTVAKEASPPTSTEFTRVLSEARLGMPLDEALDAMADRVGGEDFRWVVLAINIQRQVGGNLATLLNTVATTLREREMVRRQIKVLSAEGRLSAIILIALPFVLFGYLSVVNPDYLGQLTGATVGKIAIVIGLVLIGVGAAWMRKIVKIDV